MVEVGLARFRDLRQEAQIRDQLQLRWGLTLPLSSIGLLANSFLDGLGAAHQARAAALRRQLEQDGGYAMHVDGTCEPGTDVVFAAIEAPRSWTLVAAKMTTENIDEISKLLRRCVEDFGPPLAVMRDLSKNIQTAKEAVIPQVPDLICHYHFQENVGVKLCEKPHARLTRALRRLKIRPPLARLRRDMVFWSRRGDSPLSAARVEQLLSHPQRAAELDLVTSRRLVAYVLLRWLDDYGADLRGEYFPFDLPSLAFYRRGRQLGKWLKVVLEARDFPQGEFSTLVTMSRHLTALEDDTEVVAAAKRLGKAAALFEERCGVCGHRFRRQFGQHVGNLLGALVHGADHPPRASAVQDRPSHAYHQDTAPPSPSPGERQTIRSDNDRAAPTPTGRLTHFGGKITGILL
jgi:hypothetical protein